MFRRRKLSVSVMKILSLHAAIPGFLDIRRKIGKFFSIFFKSFYSLCQGLQLCSVIKVRDFRDFF